MKKVVIYSTHTCGFCNMLKKYLDDNSIAYDVKYADEDQALAQELFEKSGQLGVPFTIITDESGQETSILGFDRPKVNAALGLG